MQASVARHACKDQIGQRWLLRAPAELTISPVASATAVICTSWGAPTCSVSQLHFTALNGASTAQAAGGGRGQGSGVGSVSPGAAAGSASRRGLGRRPGLHARLRAPDAGSTARATMPSGKMSDRVAPLMSAPAAVASRANVKFLPRTTRGSAVFTRLSVAVGGTCGRRGRRRGQQSEGGVRAA